MLTRIGRKLRDAAGASVIMALSIMTVIAALSASMLAIAVTAPQAAIAQQREQQAYLAATSTARLLQEILTKDKTQLATLLNGAPGTTSCAIRLQKDGSTLISSNVTLKTLDITNGNMTVDISAQGYTLTDVLLTIPSP